MANLNLSLKMDLSAMQEICAELRRFVGKEHLLPADIRREFEAFTDCLDSDRPIDAWFDIVGHGLQYEAVETPRMCALVGNIRART